MRAAILILSLVTLLSLVSTWDGPFVTREDPRFAPTRPPQTAFYSTLAIVSSIIIAALIIRDAIRNTPDSEDARS
jgi:hypothetical protein